MYENPFGQPGTEEQTPSAPLTALDYAALGTAGVGGGLLSRGLYKGAKKLLAPIKNTAVAITELPGIRQTKQAITGAGNAVSEGMHNLELDGALFSAPYRQALVNDPTGLAAKHFGALNDFKIKHNDRPAITFRPEEMASILTTLGQESADPKTRKFIASGYDRLSEGDNKHLMGYLGALKSPIGEAEQAYFKRALNHAKAKKGLDNSLDLLSNPNEVGVLLGMFNKMFTNAR